jgi:glycosyltransferase involved in cell wall biosynthesis
MNVVFLMSSISRRGGGVSEAACALARELTLGGRSPVRAFALHDTCTAADLSRWAPSSVTTCRTLGPPSFGYAPTMLSRVRHARADLIHSHGLWMYPSIVALRTASGRLPDMITVHGMLDPWALRNSAVKKRLASWLFEAAHLRRSRCLHALCQAELHAIRAAGLTNPVCVVPNGVQLPPLTSQVEQDKSAIGVADSRRVLLHLGRLHPKKGLIPLIEAWHRIHRRRPRVANGWVLAIAGWEGQPGYEQELRRRIADTGLDHHVRVLGPRFGDAKTAAFRAADAFVLASLSEGLPVAVLEAWAHGLPALITPQCNLPEGVEAGAALLAQPTVDDLARAIETLLDMNDSDREHVGRKGRALVERSFTWDTIASRIRATYSWMLGGSPRPEWVDQPRLSA